MTRATTPGRATIVSLPAAGLYYVRVTNFNPSRSVGGYELGVFTAGAGSPQERFEPTVAHGTTSATTRRGRSRSAT